jgi:hypothetical protein
MMSTITTPPGWRVRNSVWPPLRRMTSVPRGAALPAAPFDFGFEAAAGGAAGRGADGFGLAVGG